MILSVSCGVGGRRASSAARRRRARGCGRRARRCRCARCSTSRIVTPRSRIRATPRRRCRRRAAPGRATARRGAARPARRRARGRSRAAAAGRPRARPPCGAGTRFRTGKSSYAALERVAAAGPAPRREPEAEVLLDGERRRRSAGPSGTSATPARAIDSELRPPQRAAAQPDLAGATAARAHDRVQRRRLARAVRADQADDLALGRPRSVRSRTAATRAVANLERRRARAPALRHRRPAPRVSPR